jgi:AMMECR1 domain-containing protein
LAVCLALWAGAARAQSRTTPEVRLTPKEKAFLLGLAREPLAALLEGRPSRAPAARPARLEETHLLVVSLSLDGRTAARAWEIRRPEPLWQGALTLGAKVLTTPDAGRPLGPEELARAKVSAAVLSGLTEIAGDAEVAAGQGVVVLSGYAFAVGLPGDVPAGSRPFELLSEACRAAGLRPGAWLGERSTLFSALADQVAED